MLQLIQTHSLALVLLLAVLQLLFENRCPGPNLKKSDYIVQVFISQQLLQGCLGIAMFENH